MVDKVKKFLRKISSERREKIEYALESIFSNDFSHLDVKKMKGSNTLYRVRIGDVRIVFDTASEIPNIRFVGKRSDVNYKNFI
jgi:mRNA-degrading endonuclease RelE of RelBE toxin-antitoxin system